MPSKLGSSVGEPDLHVEFIEIFVSDDNAYILRGIAKFLISFS
jgi:hypothetical protein